MNPFQWTTWETPDDTARVLAELLAVAAGRAMTGSCPKQMVMGPCGGVRADGRCEVIPEPCVFPAPAQWAAPVPADIADKVRHLSAAE